MGKIIKKGFTDYFSDVSEDGETVNRTATPVDILAYDNNKYAEVRLPSGEVTEIKTGYIYRDEAMTRFLREIDWFVLGGGNRKNYRPRGRKTKFTVYPPDTAKEEQARYFASRALSVAFAVRMAKRLGEEVEVWRSTQSKYCYSSGTQFIHCDKHGNAVKFNQTGKRCRRDFLQGNYMRGYGKLFARRVSKR